MILRGFPTDFSKCTFHYSDMSQNDFGLGYRTFDSLLSEADRIFLVAWPVNFNLPFESFEPHICGVRNVAKFASKASKRVAVIFISTIDTCDGWDAAEGPVPETRLENLRLPSTGYGRSKLVASLVLEDVARAGDFPATVIRVGQIAGSELEAHVGVWNRHEWIPSIIASSVYLQALPGDLAHKNSIDWMPVEKMVSIIFDLAGTSGYFHGVNPTTTTWTELAPAIQEFYGKDRIPEIVSFRDWVTRLGESQDDDARTLDKNPSLKLLGLSQAISAGHGRGTVIFSTSNTSRISQAIRNATAVTPQLMTHWCKQWKF
ncbi:ochratoxin A non-ribosomal peptide synthetase [Xylaria longipes]|nr:ochratoxin A non-ribosomal peptide synthetase [Xylaria longipes]